MEHNEKLVKNKKEIDLKAQSTTPKDKLKRCTFTEEQMMALSVRRVADVLGPVMKNEDLTR